MVRAEVFARLVAAAVFKTVEWSVKPVIGGFDSHTLPPFFSLGFSPFPEEFCDSSSLAAREAALSLTALS